MKSFIKTISTGVLGLGASFMATAAQAVVIQGGFIDIDESTNRATVDLWHFNLSSDFNIEVGLDNVNALIGDPVLSAALYENDGTGAPGAFIWAADAPDLTRLDIVSNLLAGDYIIAVSLASLTNGEFGPFHSDPQIMNTANEGPLSTYELAFTGPQEDVFTYTCRLEGNLDGTYTLTKLGGQTSNCREPDPVLISEPATVGLIGFGLLVMGLGVRGARRRRG